MDFKSLEREKEEGTQNEGDVEATQPLGEITRFVDYGEDGELVSRRKMSLVAAAKIDLLLQFLTQHIQRCGDIVQLKSNIARFIYYMTKHCYRKGLGRTSCTKSHTIQRQLERREISEGLTLRQLKVYYVY